MEFKKLSAVEAVEAVGDSVNVLIEENGVIKKAPKTAVGGGSGTGALIVLADGDNDYSVLNAPNDLYNKIIDMYVNRTIDVCSIDMHIVFSSQSRVDIDNMRSIYVYDDYVSVNGNEYGMSVYKNGEIICYYQD